MSLINEVLNRLEQRGANTAPEQTLIRAVPMRDDRHWLKPLLIGIAVLLVAVAVWRLWPDSPEAQLEPTEVSGAFVPVAASAAVEAPQEEILQPASKLSFELSAVPLPEALREPPKTKSSQPVNNRPVIAAKPNKPTEAKPAEVKATVASALEAAPLKQVSRTQQADAEYRKALLLQQQGHNAEALAGYEAALSLNAQHDAARLALAALLMESKRHSDAERTILDGLKLKPANILLSMALARVQVDHGRLDQALETLQKNLPQADDKADYQAFYAALLQREGRHKEAVNHYQIAVQLAPNSGVWLMGYAISLQAVQRTEDAKAAYEKALATQTLSPELTAFVQQKLKGF